MIHISKVIEHLYEKHMNKNAGGEPSTTNSTPGNERESSNQEMEETSSLAHSKIEIYCNDQVKSVYLTTRQWLNMNFLRVFFMIF